MFNSILIMEAEIFAYFLQTNKREVIFIENDIMILMGLSFNWGVP